MKRADYIQPPEPEGGVAERMLQVLEAQHGQIELERERSPRRKGRFLLASGVLAVAAAAAFFVVVSAHEEIPVWVGDGLVTDQQSEVKRLTDGSRVTLAGKTHLELTENSPQAMALTLHEGSAQFDVTKRPTRTFVVRAPGVTVRVRGTSFEVTSGGGSRQRVQTRVHVTEGLVSVETDAGRTFELSQGETWSTLGRDDTDATSGAEGVASASPRIPVDATPEGKVELPPGKESARDPSRVSATQPSARERSAKSLMTLGNAARARGDFEAAMRAYERVLEEHPESPSASLAGLELGRLRLKHRKGADGAADALEKSLSAKGATSMRQESLANLVEAYEQGGRLEKCQTARSQYLQEFPGGPRAAEVRRRCQ